MYKGVIIFYPKYMKDLHVIQLMIIKELIFSNALSFSDMRVKDIPNNQLDYHVKELITLGYVEKVGDKYALTKEGKTFSGYVDTDKSVTKRQAKITVWTVPLRGDEVLIYTRLKHPFFGCQGFGGGKLDYGEKITDGALRELKEETNLEGKATLVAIKHYLVFDSKTKKLVEDKFMYLCRIDNVKGELKCGEEGKYEWVKIKDLKKYVTNHFENWESFKGQLDLAIKFDGNIKVEEDVHYTEKF